MFFLYGLIKKSGFPVQPDEKIPKNRVIWSTYHILHFFAYMRACAVQRLVVQPEGQRDRLIKVRKRALSGLDILNLLYWPTHQSHTLDPTPHTPGG